MPISSQQKQWAKIGARISTLRKDKALSQTDLARLLGTTQSAVARIETGRQNQSLKMLAKISDALGKDVVNFDTAAVNFEITGGKKLSGTITTKTSKNASVVLLSAALLNKSKTILKNIPRIEEVQRLLEVLASLRVSARWEKNDIIIDPSAQVTTIKINSTSARATRSILLLIGSLIHLLPRFSLPLPGGCKLGSRTIKPHVWALEKLGVKITIKGDNFQVSAKNLHPGEVVLYESSDTATENVLLAAALIPGKTTIKYASANYQVQDLCYFLTACGVKIDGIGTTTLIVHGLKVIDQAVTFFPSEDPIESMLFLSLAAATHSSITIERCPIDFLELELLKMEKMGFKYEIKNRYKALNKQTNLVDIKTFPSKLVALEEKLYARPYPGLNIDNLPFFVPIATQAKGQTLIHDWVYENRAIYYLELSKLGANMILADPYRVYVNGLSPLRGAEIICPPALRPAAIILIAMLAAKGKSILRNVYSINRGYEDLATRLKVLGAQIRTLRDL